MIMRNKSPRKETTPEPMADKMVTDWSAYRQLAVEIEREAHADIVDRYGRTWIWRRGDAPDDLYAHDGMARLSDMITGAGPPGPMILHHPNYALCDICIDLAMRTHTFLHLPVVDVHLPEEA